MLSVKTNILWGMLLSSLVVSATHCTENSQKNDKISENKAVIVAAATEQALQNRGGVKEFTPAEEAFLKEARTFLAEVKTVSEQNLTEFRDKVLMILQDEPAYKNACVAAQAVSDLKPSFGLAKKLDGILKMIPVPMQERLQKTFKELGWKRMLQLSKPFLANIWSKKDKVQEPEVKHQEAQAPK